MLRFRKEYDKADRDGYVPISRETAELLADAVAAEPHGRGEGAPGDGRFQIGQEEVEEMIAAGGALRAGGEVHEEGQGLARAEEGLLGGLG